MNNIDKDDVLKKILEETIEKPSKDFTDNIMNIINTDVAKDLSVEKIQQKRRGLNLNLIFLISVITLAVINIIMFYSADSSMNIFESISQKYNLNIDISVKGFFIATLIISVGWIIYFMDNMLKSMFSKS